MKTNKKTSDNPKIICDDVMPTAQSFSYDAISWVTRVGTLPSAGSSRAPLSRIVSHIRTAISRWSLESYRSEIHFYCWRKEQSLIVDFTRNFAGAYLLRFDVTPMRLYVGRILETGANIFLMGDVLFW